MTHAHKHHKHPRRVPAPNEWSEPQATEMLVRRVLSGGALTVEEFFALPPRTRWLLVARRLGIVGGGE